MLNGLRDVTRSCSRLLRTLHLPGRKSCARQVKALLRSKKVTFGRWGCSAKAIARERPAGPKPIQAMSRSGVVGVLGDGDLLADGDALAVEDVFDEGNMLVEEDALVEDDIVGPLCFLDDGGIDGKGGEGKSLTILCWFSRVATK